jgi:PTH1 family peptidyl-tRNA hydrolase
MLKLWVGLGNPGARYANTRHNFGFMAIDRLAISLGVGEFGEKFRGHFIYDHARSIILFKPLTYMNLSGIAVREVANFYKVAKIVVFHDELDIPLGKVRCKTGGSDAGHKGLVSISQNMGTHDYQRIRLGISRPLMQDVADYVVSPFLAQEQGVVDVVLNKIVEHTDMLLNDDYNSFAVAVNKVVT